MTRRRPPRLALSGLALAAACASDPSGPAPEGGGGPSRGAAIATTAVDPPEMGRPRPKRIPGEVPAAER